MKINSIYIDGLHSVINKSYRFGDIVYIFGNNGTGKSTILQAIQFALLGYIPGTAKNSREALLRHSPINKIEVELSLSNNDEYIIIHRRLDSKGTVLEITPEGYNIKSIISDIELPIFNFNEFVNQTANKLKEYFIKNILPTSNGELDWQRILSESIIDFNFENRDDIVDYGMSMVSQLEGDTLDQVIAANAKFKEEQSFNKSEIQRLQNTIDSLIFYDDYTGPTNLAEITSNLLSLNAIRDQLIKYESAMSATQAANDELAILQSDLTKLGTQEDYNNLREKLPLLKSRYEEYNRLIAEVRDRLSTLRANDSTAESIINSKGMCPYTKESCKSILHKIDDIRNESAARKAKSIELNQKIDEYTSNQSGLQIKITQCQSTINDFDTTWNRIITIQKTLSDLPMKPNTEKSIQELDTEIDSLTESKMKLQANIQYNETIENITKLKYEAELQSKALSAWVKKTDTNGLQTTLMLEPFESLAHTMTEYIQQMYGNDKLKAHFNLSTKANSFSFGLIRDNVYIPYDLLSSGEKCLYTLALMICITNKTSSPLKLLLLDDAFDHLDSVAIENTFAALKNINNIQFIFAGVKDCNNAKDIMIQP